MPQAHKQRGRRMKRKQDEIADDSNLAESSKRRRSMNADAANQEDMTASDDHHYAGDEDVAGAYPAQEEKAFFGILDEEEQGALKMADETLEKNEFDDPEQRAVFLEEVWKMADGKELKIAQSQSCSRLMERLIHHSTATQLKNLFQTFSGNFIHLLSHRFASHCCESLFARAAPLVSEEVLKGETANVDQANVNDIFVTVEELFLRTIAELEGNIGFLLTDKYASHALRIMLLVLSGQPLSTGSMKALLQSKRKENVKVSGEDKTKDEAAAKKRPVPESFSKALEKLISDSVAGLDTDKLRALATHTNANPTLQLLISLELDHYGKSRAKNEKSIIRTLLPDDPITADTKSATFMGGMVYDPVGSHLVEKIIECAPGQLFKALYNSFFKERLVTYARNETGTYVVCRILERLGYDDLLVAHEILCPVIPTLLEKSWTSMTRTLIERCTVREIDTQVIAVQVDQTFQDKDGFDLAQMIRLNSKPHPADGVPAQNNNADSSLARPAQSSKVHFNILAQAMLIVPGSLSAMIIDGLIAFDTEMLVNVATDPVTSRTLQQALTTKNASVPQRRKLIQRFYGRMGEMALDKYASHVVDCIWEGTHGLAFIRERIAEELAENEAALRESPSGRGVWKNWKMDMYKRKRSEWVRQSKVKASNDGFQSFSELDKQKKTPLQLAQERHAANKGKKERTKEKPQQQVQEERGRRTERVSRSAAESVRTRRTASAAAAS